MTQIASMTRASNARGRMQASAALALACGLMSPLAMAVDAGRYDYQGAAGICQPSLPQYEANLRSRPLALANEGDATAFVTCAFQGDTATIGRGAQRVAVNITNNDVTGKTVTCTLITGAQSGGTSNATYTPKSIGLFAGGSGFIFWIPSDIGAAEIYQPAVSCGLEPKTTLQYTGINYAEDIGN